jgi:hypothetical protein
MKINKFVLLIWASPFMLACSSLPSTATVLTPTDEQIVSSYVTQMIPRRERVLFFQLCSNLDIRPSLGAALGWHESTMKGFLISAKNKDGTIDEGYFQLNSGETAQFSIEFWDGRSFEPFNGRENMITGLKYLHAKLINTHGDEAMALRLYNAGPKALRRGSFAGVEYAATVLGVEKEIIDAARLYYYENASIKISN